MAYFGKTSKKRLAECDCSLVDLFFAVIEHYNCTILTGHRDRKAQNKAVADGKSKLKYPKSKHNKKPSRAVDVAPWFSKKPHVRWWDTKSFYHFGGLVSGVAAELGINIRWGGNWDMDDELYDQDFMDLIHFELLDE